MRKLSSIQERLKLKSSTSLIAKAFLVLSIATISGLLPAAETVYADEFDAQINQLKQENNENIANQEELVEKEADITEQVDKLQKNIATTEKQISDSQAKLKKIDARIADVEAEMSVERRLLGVNIKQLYLDDQMSTIEKLATSKSISEYADKEQYNVSIQNKIEESLERINELKAEQEKQKADAEKLLSDQESMKKQLTEQKKESNRLLKLNRSQQEEYKTEVQKNNAKIAELRRQQAEENARHNVGAVSYTRTVNSTGNSYPWANVAFPNSSPDPWGMYKRQCVSYTAWKVADSGRHMPFWGGRGNAKLWDDNARAAGIPVDYSPRVGDVAISNAGTYGHAMYVEAVHGDGTITISQYNANWDGRYSEVRRSTSGLVFIHF